MPEPQPVDLGPAMQWFWVDDRRPLWRAMALGGVVLTVGFGLFGWSVADEGMRLDARISLTLGALLVIAASGVLTFRRVRQALNQEPWLVVHTAGLRFCDEARPLSLRWEDLETVSFEAASNTVRFTPRDSEAFEVPANTFAGGGKEVATKLETLRRKAVFGLL